MTPTQYIALRQSEGLNLTTAASELASITGCSMRSVWSWLKGSKVPAYAQKLLAIYSTCNPAQRDLWFPSPNRSA